jgi:dephospho-CoA kinase
VYVIGLTGGIGTGKSTVSSILRRQGAFVVDADALAHAVLAPGTPAVDEVARAFPGVVRDGVVDRARLAELVFEDPASREVLNAIVHPRVRHLMREALEEAVLAGHEVAVLDVPLLIEGGLHNQVDEVWVVYADEAEQVRRIMERNHVDRETAYRRIRAQMPIDEKVKFADVVIDNRGDLASLERQVAALWAERVRRHGRPPD